MVEIAFLLKKSPWIAVAVHVLRGVWAVKSQNKFRVGGVEPPRVFVAFKSHRSPLSGSFFRGIRRVSHWERAREGDTSTSALTVTKSKGWRNMASRGLSLSRAPLYCSKSISAEIQEIFQSKFSPPPLRSRLIFLLIPDLFPSLRNFRFYRVFQGIFYNVCTSFLRIATVVQDGPF